MQTEVAVSDLSKLFKQLEPLDDPGALLHVEAVHAANDRRLRNIITCADGKTMSIRFFILGTYRYFAYAPVDQLGDLARFADVLFHYLKPFRRRGKDLPISDADLNFNTFQLEADIEYFKNERLDVQELIDKLVERVREAYEAREVRAPSWRSKNGIERISAFFAKLLQSNQTNQQDTARRLDEVSKQLNDALSMLRVLDKQIEQLLARDTAQCLPGYPFPPGSSPLPEEKNEPSTPQIECNSNDTAPSASSPT